jgi:redox-sensitive bicupin YhaK (pirin superfamily)
MMQVLKSDDRGHANHGWLDTHFSFSFSDYYDPRRMGFRHLRVINEDTIEPGGEFGMHPHEDMEIITYILEGAIEHKDSMGNGGIIYPGEIQRMSAGSGIRHSESNPSKTESTHLLQIWLFPNKRGLTPTYEQKKLPREDRLNSLQKLAGPEGAGGLVTIQQDAELYSSLLSNGKTVKHDFAEGRHGWLQMARGGAIVNGTPVEAGDGVALEGESSITIEGTAPESEFLLFDLV